MKRRVHDALLGIVGLAGVTFIALSGAGCETPVMQCAVGHGPFIARYTVTSGDAACYPGGTTEEIGFATYLQSKPKTSTTVTNSEGGTYTVVTSEGADYNTRKIALQSTTMGNLLQERTGAGLKEGGAAYTFGTYTNLPDSGNICFAFGNGQTTENVAELDVEAFDTGEVDEMTMMPIIAPAVHYKQTWSNVRLYVTAGIPGTQAVGEMTFENLTPGEECTASFKFVALYPAAHCIAEVLIDQNCDHDGDPATPEKLCEGIVVREEPDNDLCLAKAEEGWTKPPPGTEYKAARVFGSGINPDFKTTCDADSGYCVLATDPLTGNP